MLKEGNGLFMFCCSSHSLDGFIKLHGYKFQQKYKINCLQSGKGTQAKHGKACMGLSSLCHPDNFDDWFFLSLYFFVYQLFLRLLARLLITEFYWGLNSLINSITTIIACLIFPACFMEPTS